MLKRSVLMGVALAVLLIVWAAVSRDTFPLVMLAALALVLALVTFGPSDSRPDPRDSQDAAEDIAQRSRHSEGLF